MSAYDEINAMVKKAQTPGSLAISTAGAIVGSGLGAIIGRQIAINRHRKNVTRSTMMSDFGFLRMALKLRHSLIL